MCVYVYVGTNNELFSSGKAYKLSDCACSIVSSSKLMGISTDLPLRPVRFSNIQVLMAVSIPLPGGHC